MLPEPPKARQPETVAKEAAKQRPAIAEVIALASNQHVAEEQQPAVFSPTDPQNKQVARLEVAAIFQEADQTPKRRPVQKTELTALPAIEPEAALIATDIETVIPSFSQEPLAATVQEHDDLADIYAEAINEFEEMSHDSFLDESKIDFAEPAAEVVTTVLPAERVLQQIESATPAFEITEPIVVLIQHLPEVMQVSMAEFVTITAPEMLDEAEELLVKISVAANRLHELSIVDQEDTNETVAIAALIAEWYEELGVLIGVEINEEMIAELIACIRSEQYVLEVVPEKEPIDEGMRNFKQGISKFARSVSEARQILTQEIGRLLLQQAA